MSEENGVRRIQLGPAECALDLGDGSERAAYVNQDYILRQLGRPHRCVNIMYTYYPHDAQWPQRISEACKDMNITFQWDYPYDDYFPFGVDGEPFAQMRDIRRHGQDVLLTLTADCSLTDEEIRAVARQLRPYGRMKLRINHECSGTWFTHNKRYTYHQVAEFFVRFHRIVKEEAPNVSTIFCAGVLQPDGHLEKEKEFLSAYQAADEWSTDRYLALHYGWPYDVAEVGGGQYNAYTVADTVKAFRDTASYLHRLCGPKPFCTAEMNVDGDVTGPRHQGEALLRFAHALRDEKADWFRAISLYQFRDRGRLGLEMEDPNNERVGIPQPLLNTYRQLLKEPYFMPKITETAEPVTFPAALRWGGAEDAEGLALPISFAGTPEFCEMTVAQEIGLMVELNGRWFYKAPQVKTIDLMSAFFYAPLNGPTTLTLKLFAPPTSGLNPENGLEDWAVNYRATLNEPPKMRIRYEVPGLVG